VKFVPAGKVKRQQVFFFGKKKQKTFDKKKGSLCFPGITVCESRYSSIF